VVNGLSRRLGGFDSRLPRFLVESGSTVDQPKVLSQNGR
jgi:hypothetical protein